MMATLELRPGAFSPNAHPAQYRNEDFPVIPSSRLRARPGDFPPLGGRASHHANYNHAAGSPVVPGISGERRTNAWKEEKVLFPDTSAGTPVSYNSVPPQASYSTPLNAAPRGSIQQPASNNKIQTIPAAEDPAESGRHTTTSSGRIIDPNHPDFNAAVFYNDLLNKFVCPYKLCRYVTFLRS
jgi:hypothetical protein